MAALAVWTERTGYSFGVFNERTTQALNLPVSSTTGITFTVISGKLPPGMRIQGSQIVGTPYEVARETKFEFCIRASKKVYDTSVPPVYIRTNMADRTFSITIIGSDDPEFVTPLGALAINQNATQYFVLDSSYVDFQIEAYDRDTATEQTLSFFIADDGGALPPGLSLSKDGRITGLVEPALSIKPTDGDGSFDSEYYDSVAFDFGSRPSNGWDSYVYDSVYFDFSIPSGAPKKLNRNYEFVVTMTDGDSIATRRFGIFVVGDDYFRADNSDLLDGTNLFTADATYLRAPIWLTKSNLGLYRANNYLTVMLDTYDTNQVIYSLEEINADVVAVTQRKASSDNKIDNYTLTIKETLTAPAVGQYLTFGGLFEITDPLTEEIIAQPDYRKYQISDVDLIGVNEYRLTITTALQLDIPNGITFYIGDLGALPPGMSFDALTGEIYGVVPYQPAITKEYRFTVTATRFSDKGEYAPAPRVFTINIIGEVESVITWISPSSLGSVSANYVSTLKVEATTSIPGAVVIYTKVDGRLPPGLSLNFDGEIIGKATQFGDGIDINLKPGLTRFYDVVSGERVFTNLDAGETTIDRVYTFTVEAKDQLGYSASTQTFHITVDTPNSITYGNLKTKPFLKLDQRARWRDFISDTSIFTFNSIYRPNDPNFGVQTDLSMLIYAGIETTEAAAYIAAMGLNHKRKRFQFGSIKKATAVLPGTSTPVYEVVYVQMIDPSEPNGKRLPNELPNLGLRPERIKANTGNELWTPGFSPANSTAGINSMSRPGNAQRPDPFTTANSTGYQISNNNITNYFPNSVSNWRDRLEASYKLIPDPNNPGSFISVPLISERNYLPLWMRSIQPGGTQELDFQLAIPLCYCKPGTADDILLNIKFSKFDFKLLDYTADRYIIDAVKGETADKYLVFKNDRITV
jgi:hypothetical protein